MTPEEEDRGWQALLERWGDDEAHRSWLAGFSDLEGLARAGQRYRAHLAAHTGDAIAARWRDEVVKRAMVQGLASLPRARPAPAIPRWARIGAIAAAGAALAWTAWWAAERILAILRAR